MALTACPSLTFDNMKAALKRIFGETTPQRGSDALQVSGDATDAACYTKFTAGEKVGQICNIKQLFKVPILLDRYGRRTRCTICQSVYHWVKDCPHKNEHAKLTEDERQTEFEECNITLLSKDTLSNTEIFMVESLGSAVIDSLHQNGVWRKWLDHYVSHLKQDELLKMKDIKSARPFKFGNWRIAHSTKKLKIPAVIAQTRCQIETEVIPDDIPLLLSKTSLKRAGAVLDIENDEAIMFKQPVKLELTSSGHYCVNLRDESTLKFGHASVDRLKKLLTCSGNTDEECTTILRDIVKNCETCIRYSKPKQKPAVGLPMASTYNETVAMDFKS